LQVGNRQNKKNKEIVMKRKIFITALAVSLIIGTGMSFAQMMGGGPGPAMMEGTDQQQAAPPAQQQNSPYQMYPGMMGPGYGGYDMGSGMMGPGYGGYGMGPGMMGPGYGGYGMGPGMMGPGYGGYGMGPGMMGPGYGGYGMGPGMMGPGQWGGCGGWYQGGPGEYGEKYNKALEETRELRRQLNVLQFDYYEALRNPNITTEKKKDMAKEIFELNEKIRQKMHQ
jgi:hypothetical protein